MQEPINMGVPKPKTIFEAMELTKELTKDYDESHNFQHHKDVFDNAMLIAGNGLPDRVGFMIMFAAILHDTIDHKYKDTIETNTQRLNDFLAETTDGDSIKWIIDNISYSKEVKNGYPIHDDPEVQFARDVVSDADKLEAMGVEGIERCYQFTRAFNPDLDEVEVKILVIKHCHEKLLGLSKYLRTDIAKSMAELFNAETREFVEKNQ